MKFLIVLATVLSIAVAGVVPPYALPVPLADVREGRITNGNAAAANQFPYQVGLSLKRSALSTSWCGGSLITKTWVLTAAHCTYGVKSATVMLGSTVRTSPKWSHTVDKSQIIIHKGYNDKTLVNDISLIKIPAVTLSDSIQLVRLPTQSGNYATYAGDYAIASGWGRTSDNSAAASNLNWARLQVITNAVCAKTYGTKTVNSGTLCVATPQGVSTCQGDSGGPLVQESTKILGLPHS